MERSAAEASNDPWESPYFCHGGVAASLRMHDGGYGN